MASYALVSYTDASYDVGSGKYLFDLTIKNLGSTITSGSLIQWNHFKTAYGGLVSEYHDSGSPSLVLSSTKASSIIPTPFSSWGYKLTLNENIDTDEELTISVELTETYGAYISELFSFSGDTPFTILFSHYGRRVGIPEGLYAGSTSVKLMADMPTGTTLYLYKRLTLLGSATIADGTPGYALVTPNESIVAGEAYTGYAHRVGYGTFGAFLATTEPTTKTGWKEASLLTLGEDDTTYADYLAAGGEPIADYYDPKNTTNRAALYNCEVIDFDLTPRFDLEIVRDGDDFTVTVVNASPYLGSPRFIWDSGEETTDNFATYVADAGVHTVTIFHETDDTITASRSFEIDDSINSYTSEIWGVSYEPNQSDNKQVALIAYSDDVAGLEARIPEIGATWYAMSLVSSSTHKYTKAGQYYNVTAGTKTIEVRRVGQPSAEVTQVIKLDW